MKFKKNNIVKIISIICAILFFALVCILVFQFITIANLKSKEKQLSNQLNNVEQQIVEYTNQNDYFHSNEYLEDYAREVLGWGQNGEMIFK